MSNDMISKIPLRAHLNNIKRIMKIQVEMDRYYFLSACLYHILTVLIPYTSLWMSAYIIDAISGREKFQKVIVVMAVCAFSMFILQCTKSSLWCKLEVRRKRMGNLYDYKVQEKLLTMDFSRIDSPELRKLRDRIYNDLGWGARFHSVIYNGNRILSTFFSMVGAIIMGIPIFVYIVNTTYKAVWVVLVLTSIVITICIKKRIHYEKINKQFMFEEWTEEQVNYIFPFALGNDFNYRNGKDTRIYNSYDLIQYWTIDVMKRKGYRDRIKNGCIGNGGEMFFTGVIRGIVEGAAYLLVAILAIAGTMSVGNVVKLAGCLKNFISGIVDIINSVSSFALTARQQMSTLELLSLEDEMYKGKLPIEKRSDNEYQIEFRNVSFRYPGSEQYALKNFSLKLKIGEKLAIVGMNGSGKTTMIKLLCRLYDPSEGEILLNGVDIRKFKQDEYSQLFSVVFQDYVLFPYTLGQNVAANMEYDSSLVVKCLKDAGFDDRLSLLSNELDTYLYTDYDDKGVQISGGEAQKIAIARAIYKDAPFVLLDEPTAALDPISEYEVYTNFDRIVNNKTAIYISHRLASCRFCDKIAVFDEGCLIQTGSHEELVKETNGKYYEMWKAQAQYYKDKGEEWKLIFQEG